MGGGRKSRQPSEAERALWRTVMRDVTPLPHQQPLSAEEDALLPAPPAPAQPVEPRRTEPPPAPRPKAPLPQLANGKAPGVDRRTVDRLNRGTMDIEGRLDLHGMSQEQAYGALKGFLAGAQNSGKRCVIVITGKGLREGTGILRAQVPRWLNEAGLRERVLAFHTARPQHGGEGALYVLIKRIR